MKRSLLSLSAAICGGVLLIDQSLKIWVKTHMQLGESISIAGRWFLLHFIENNGMAYGLEFGGEYGKMFLTLFRIVAIGVLSWYIIGLTKKNATKGAIISLSLILAGAAGNVIDCLFYGQLFGYQSFLHGKVVDMLYFPLFEGFLPNWIPFWGGQYFTFFSAIFNVADFAISLGVGMLLVFQKSFFPPINDQALETSTDEIDSSISSS